ncbi:hypothetical protein V6N13_035844 [Hibiscus sabdariffa]
MLLHRPEAAAAPVFRPDPESSSYRAHMKPLPEGLWTTGFFTCICPCITMGQNSEIINRGEIACRSASLLHLATGVVLFGWIFGSKNRRKLREHFSLPETPLPDWATHLLCMWCTLCQEHRELRTRGADPSLGWEGNLSKWMKDGVTPPIVVPRMAK